MKYVCMICGHIYDEEKEGIPFSSLPDDWKCPVCKAAKSDFEPLEEKTENDDHSLKVQDEELSKLSTGQLAALCSNLSRGCEKMYRSREALLFRELADHFSSFRTQVPDPDIEDIASKLLQDTKEYRTLREVADSNSDRGAARVCVWGEKVTRMLSSLVGRYLEEGEKLLEEADIYVCTVCGFVYIGDAPPSLCPVCKVPSWKFEKIDERSAL